MRRLLAVFVALTCALTLAPGSGAEAVSTDLSGGDDLAWAVDLERKIADNIWDGQVYEIDYAPGAERTRANITSVNHFGDSALWTGTYLASQSYRYAVAKKYIAELTAKIPANQLKPGRKTNKKWAPLKEQLAFWTASRNEAKSRVDQMVDKFHVLSNISQDWNHKLAVEPSQPGFGGGVLKGEPGYLMRACIPTDTPEAYRWSDAELTPPAGSSAPYTKNKRVFGPLEFEGKSYWCENGTSRDAYAGTTFGLLTAFDIVGPDDAEMREQIGNDLITLVNFAVKYAWMSPRPHGRISLPVPGCSLPGCGHDFENFISPHFFLQVPLARLNMANVARHVAETLDRPDRDRWEAVWNEEVATQVPLLAGSMQFDAADPNSAYYKFNLHHLTGFNITRTAPSDLLRQEFKRAFAAMDKTTGDDLNAHFETITYALTGEQSRLTDAVTHLRQWRDYRERIDAGIPATNSTKCGNEITCVQQDQREILVGDDAVVLPGTSGRRARLPLPIADRVPTDFLWQREPTRLDGSEPVTHQVPGIDYLLPYWMIRYHTELAPVAEEPFPEWPGPAHR